MQTLVKVINRSGLDLPTYETPASAGMDVRAAITDPILLEPGARALVPTGLYFELPPGTEAQVRPRSGLAIKKGITVLNAPGTIDADYRGEVGVILINLSQEIFEVLPGMRVAQIVFAQYQQIAWEQTQGLSSTERGAGGFGSTGLN